MDPHTFDRLTANIAGQRSRRAALGLFSGAALAGLFSPRLARGAQRSDRDGDGLFDDDETGVYGTNPDFSDTDGDGWGDGTEIYYGTNPLDPNSHDEIVGNGDLGLGEPADPSNTIDIAPVACFGSGVPCDYDGQCCAGSLCCWDGVDLRTECIDVSAYGGSCRGVSWPSCTPGRAQPSR